MLNDKRKLLIPIDWVILSISIEFNIFIHPIDILKILLIFFFIFFYIKLWLSNILVRIYHILFH